MKKIGIATLYTGSTNYGGCLQSYALCKVLKDMGYDPYQILFKSKELSTKEKIIRTIKSRRLFSMLRIRFRSIIESLQNKYYKVDNDIEIFKSSFSEFRDSIPHTSTLYNDITLTQCNDFDVYITGSDQVWNIGETYNINNFYWLNFIGNEKIKLSYAASISTKDIPISLYPTIRKILSNYRAISVREKQDKQLLDSILGKEIVEWVLDPTLLLSREQWDNLCIDNPYASTSYVFVYLLGDNKKQRAIITKWAKKTNKKIITIPFLLGTYRSCDCNFGDIRLFKVSPNLWLSLIRDADCVITDSFHATIFSSVFHTPFFIFKRSKDSSKNSMNSRIYSLMQLYDTNDRIIDDNINIEDFPPLNTIDYGTIDKVIMLERNKSISFLHDAIEG